MMLKTGLALGALALLSTTAGFRYMEPRAAQRPEEAPVIPEHLSCTNADDLLKVARMHQGMERTALLWSLRETKRCTGSGDGTPVSLD